MTGVLPIALENATKAMPVLMGLDKEYVGVMHLHKEIDETILRKVITEKFIGKIVQVPPVKSAVARKPRERRIYYFDILEIDGKDVLFKIGCEAGTYVRKVVHDLGLALKVGAHMTELRRTKAGNFTEDKAWPLVKIKDAYEFWNEGNETLLKKILIPVEEAISHVKKVFVKDSTIYNIACGAPVYVNGITRIQEGIEKGETVGVFSLKEELIALGIAKMNSKEMLERKKGVAVRTDRVFIKKDVYPKLISSF
ncbi:MAG: RNA-guided pseudouridylation complex pseudouridine synthase subunit Cbf5 [Candidatus Aenigmatarchaeota archaeon]